jgi:hypothetical protein
MAANVLSNRSARQVSSLLCGYDNNENNFSLCNSTDTWKPVQKHHAKQRPCIVSVTSNVVFVIGSRVMVEPVMEHKTIGLQEFGALPMT